MAMKQITIHGESRIVKYFFVCPYCQSTTKRGYHHDDLIEFRRKDFGKTIQCISCLYKLRIKKISITNL